jgi:endo-1,3-1,4-beta-glycanase ExoK
MVADDDHGIVMNLWPGIGVDGWLQPFTCPATKLTATYDRAQYTTY